MEETVGDRQIGKRETRTARMSPSTYHKEHRTYVVYKLAVEVTPVTVRIPAPPSKTSVASSYSSEIKAEAVIAVNAV